MSFRPLEGITSLFHDAGAGMLRISGGWGNIPGPGLFMMRTIVAGTTSAITFGMAGSALCIPFFGTAALPFMICSTFGYVYGMLGFYLNAVERAHVALERYPTLMLLHMDANFPRHRGPRSGAILEAASKSWILQSMLVVSWLTAQPALSALLDSHEQATVAKADESKVLAAIEVQRRNEE